MTTAWLAGGTGLVGGELLRQLLDDPQFSRVLAVGRRPLTLEHPKLAQARLDFASPAAFDALEPPAVAFSCLGTTIKKAGSREAFRAVDHEAVLAFARAARKKGAGVFVHVSSLGTDVRSRAFYLSVKGEVERDVARVTFPSVYALRPSMLDGRREERRPAEAVGLVVMRALGPLLGRYRPTKVEAVARVMIASAKGAAPGVHVIEADAIR
jgi:uncharacterized protein YbjT (DUF2867 family)